MITDRCEIVMRPVHYLYGTETLVNTYFRFALGIVTRIDEDDFSSGSGKSSLQSLNIGIALQGTVNVICVENDCFSCVIALPPCDLGP